jgi:hypothetical protein
VFSRSGRCNAVAPSSREYHPAELQDEDARPDSPMNTVRLGPQLELALTRQWRSAEFQPSARSAEFQTSPRSAEFRPSPRGAEFQTSPRSAGEFHWQAQSFRNVDDARQTLSRIVRWPDDMTKIRSLVVVDGWIAANRLSDHQVLDRAAALLAQRQVVLARKVAGALPGKKDEEKEKERPRPSMSSGPALSPSMLIAREAQARSPLPAPSAPPVEADLPAIDQDAQAAVLRQAAADGVPFCEECEKLKREKAARAGQGN